MQSINTPAWVPGLPFGANSFREEDDSFGQPTPLPPSFTEYYTQSNGSNLNAGSDQNSSAKFTSTNGNWSTVTNIFTPTDGTNPVSAGVNPNDFASIYIDGATVGVFITRITAVVDAANGPITVSSTAVAGTAPVTSATARTIKVGGAWLGPNAASGFPFTLTNIGTNKNILGNRVRVNMKNDADYSLTSVVAYDSGAGLTTQGYTTLVGDGGKATWNGGTSTGAIISSPGGSHNQFVDLIFKTSIGSGTSDLVIANIISTWIRCVFTGSRQKGLSFTAAACSAIECEAYSCNQANTASMGAFHATGLATYLRCIAHDNTTSNTSGFHCTTAPLQMIECISVRNGKNGVTFVFSAQQGVCMVANSDFYNNSGDAINYNGVNPIHVENCNFVLNGGAGINNIGILFISGWSYNNTYGSNGRNDTLGNIIEVGKLTYPAGITPYRDPVNLKFDIVLATCISSGRGAFTITQAAMGPTIGYPDTGAAQSNSVTTSPAWAGGDFILPAGYVSHAYPQYQWAFTVNTSFSLLSGSLPTGLALIAVSSTTASIAGTPTVVGTYDFVLRATIGTSTGDATFHITVLADPDEGAGGVGGG